MSMRIRDGQDVRQNDADVFPFLQLLVYAKLS